MIITTEVELLLLSPHISLILTPYTSNTNILMMTSDSVQNICRYGVGQQKGGKK